MEKGKRDRETRPAAREADRERKTAHGKDPGRLGERGVSPGVQALESGPIPDRAFWKPVCGGWSTAWCFTAFGIIGLGGYTAAGAC
jgi:hypothetical protein